MELLLKEIIEAIEEKQGKNIVSLDLSKLDGAIASSFVICNADSTTQVEAIAHEVERHVREKLREKPLRVEGLTNGVWVVMDYFDIMVHIFQTETRGFYNLEELWADAQLTKYGKEVLVKSGKTEK